MDCDGKFLAPIAIQLSYVRRLFSHRLAEVTVIRVETAVP